MKHPTIAPERGENVDIVANARLTGAERLDPFADEPVDVHLAGGAIVDIAPAGGLPRRGAVLDAEGGWLIPGLWDHHVHTVPWALSAQRTGLLAAESAAHAARLMADSPVLADGRRIGVGFRDAFWPDQPTIEMLDAATGDIPTYLINADVHSAWLNSAALRREAMSVADGSGILREEPAFEVSRRLNDLDAALSDPYVEGALAAAAARGVVGIVDLDMAWNEDAWRRRLAGGFDTQRVRFGLYPMHLERAIAAGLRSGARLRDAASDLVEVGPLKVISDGSLGTRTAACSHPYPGDPHDHGVLTVDPERLSALMHRAAAAGLECAVHAIGDVANARALDAFAATGATGTIEHAQLVAHTDIPRFARLGVSASVQPEHAIDDRDLTDTVWAEQTALAYPLRSLADAGVSLRFGSDAPVSPLDPWAAMAGAVHRTRGGRPAWRPDQALDAGRALAASTRHGSGDDAVQVLPGRDADLVVCGHDPLTATEEQLRGMSVAATLLGGRLTHRA